MLHKQGLVKLFKCHPVLLQKQKQDRMKNKQIHLWFRKKYSEEQKAENELAIVVKEIFNKLQREKSWKKGFLKIMKNYATLLKA